MLAASAINKTSHEKSERIVHKIKYCKREGTSRRASEPGWVEVREIEQGRRDNEVGLDIF